MFLFCVVRIIVVTRSQVQTIRNADITALQGTLNTLTPEPFMSLLYDVTFYIVFIGYLPYTRDGLTPLVTASENCQYETVETVQFYLNHTVA